MANGSNQQWGLTVLRVIVGIVFLVHGAQKLFVFGFHGVAGMLGGMGIPVPAVSAVILTLVEFLGGIRSEEHTSELQSQSNLVCRLLLEKKKIRLHMIRPGRARRGRVIRTPGSRHAGDQVRGLRKARVR